MFRDVRERRQVEQALRDSEERFHALADNIAQLASIADEPAPSPGATGDGSTTPASRPRSCWAGDGRRWFIRIGAGRRREIRWALEAREGWEATFLLRGANGTTDGSSHARRRFATNTAGSCGGSARTPTSPTSGGPKRC